ncbi:tetratricopeptide repeat protein [Marinobacter confluentis]|uniref:Tetratricopeptide repeat protein n=1 Tax=Marinobacter confluentis TaxID=1697557 RepID=A0A4Z1BGF4_9GAMM|nr:tetratricopeptide repeat protein [Marinobacter confluentis]TGN38355.1 tetratricopeptide repeat protein [Marinobacter confluentis]
MTSKLIQKFTIIALAAALSACATGPGGGSIYVPAETDDTTAPEPPRIDPGADEPRVERKSEQPDTERRSPSYQDEGDELPAAARGLIGQAESLLAAGDAQGAVSQLERAQRIAPRSAEVYFGLAEAYVALNQLGAAEQFALKGLSLAGSDSLLQRNGWLLMADIRRARGNVAGADQAEARAGAL